MINEVAVVWVIKSILNKPHAQAGNNCREPNILFSPTPHQFAGDNATLVPASAAFWKIKGYPNLNENSLSHQAKGKQHFCLTEETEDDSLRKMSVYLQPICFHFPNYQNVHLQYQGSAIAEMVFNRHIRVHFSDVRLQGRE